MLRLFLCLGKHAPETIWPWLILRMEQAGSNDKVRTVLLVIYRHLVYAFGNDAPTSIFDHKSLLVSSLRTTTNTATLKVCTFEIIDSMRWNFIDLDYEISIPIDCGNGLSWLFTIRRRNLFNRIYY